MGRGVGHLSAASDNADYSPEPDGDISTVGEAGDPGATDQTQIIERYNHASLRSISHIPLIVEKIYGDLSLDDLLAMARLMPETRVEAFRILLQPDSAAGRSLGQLFNPRVIGSPRISGWWRNSFVTPNVEKEKREAIVNFLSAPREELTLDLQANTGLVGDAKRMLSQEELLDILKYGVDRSAPHALFSEPQKSVSEYERVIRLLREVGVDIDWIPHQDENTRYRNPLFYTAAMENVPLAEALAHCDARVDVTDYNGYDSLSALFREGISPKLGQLEVEERVVTLLRLGLNPNGGGSIRGNFDPRVWGSGLDPKPLHLLAANPAIDPTLIFQALIEAGADPLAVDCHGQAPLRIAVYERNAPMTSLLDDFGVPLVNLDNDANNILHIASQRYIGSPARLAKWLDGRIDIDAANEHGRTPLWYAIYCSQTGFIEALLATGRVNLEALGEAPDCRRLVGPVWTPLQQAIFRAGQLSAQYGSLAVVECLLKAGANANVRTFQGKTPLHCARDVTYSVAIAPVTKLLLRYGAEPHLAD